MTIDFRDHTLEGLAADVRAGRCSAAELVGAALARIEALDGELGAFVAVDAARATADAARIDERLVHGDDVGPLAGIPVAVKDAQDAVGYVTTHGSALHVDEPAATVDDLLVARLRAAGAVVVGKTNMPEHGWKADTTSVPFGAAHNPWSLDRSPGGSSGGTAAALAAGLVPLATGSDGGGSIRIPSSACALSGFKPSFGRIPKATDTAPDWLFLSISGPMARRVRDVAYALDAVVGPDLHDPRSLPAPEASWRSALDDPVVPARVAWSPDLGYARVDDEVAEVCETAVAALDDAGCEVVRIDGPFDADPVGPWLALANSGILRALLPHRERWDRMDPELRTMIEWTEANVTALDVIGGLDAAHELTARMAPVFETCEVLLCPTIAGIIPRSGELGTINGEPDPNWVQLTYPFNLTGSPAGTVCAGFTRDGLPIGLQVVGPTCGDVAVLRTMAVLEDLLALDTVAPFARR